MYAHIKKLRTEGGGGGGVAKMLLTYYMDAPIHNFTNKIVQGFLYFYGFS